MEIKASAMNWPVKPERTEEVKPALSHQSKEKGGGRPFLMTDGKWRKCGVDRRTMTWD